jgi:putative glutamine amidotransferase
MAYPKIGISTYQGKNDENIAIVALARAYIDAIVQAGGVPVLILSSLKDRNRQALYNLLDGILFSGVGDIDLGGFSGEPNLHVGNVDAERDSNEIALLETLSHDENLSLEFAEVFK